LQGAKPLAAIAQVWSERPFAIIQIVAFLSWLEIRLINQKKQLGEPAGDFGWDPLGLKPSDPETWEKVQLRELKNGRLAMIGIAGMLLAEAGNGLGVAEVWQLKAANPF
jgi:Chlorophyll A-B binding protein